MIACTEQHQLMIDLSGLEPFRFQEAVIVIEPWDRGVQWSSRMDGCLETFEALPDPGLPFALLARERGAAAWLTRIPAAFVPPVLAYEERHQTNAFPLLWFLSRSDRARDLFASQPGLVWLILESAREADWPTDRVLALFGEKRAKIVNVCIQGQKFTLKTLSKIQSARWGRHEFELLKALPALPQAAALNHLRVLDFRLLEFLVHFPRLIGSRLLTPYQADWPWARFSELVGDTLLVAANLGIRDIFERIGACGSVPDLAQLHNRLVVRLNQVELEQAPLVEYPPPPVPGTADIKGHEVKLLESRGSLENLQRLGAGEAQLGFAQLDAYAQYLKSGGPPLEIVVSLGQECGYLVVKKDGKVTSEKDLRRVKEAIIAIGEEGSGSAITWQYMTTLVPDYRNARIVYQGGTRALNQIGTPGGPDAFLFITAPDHLEHKLIQAVNANKELRFVDMDKGGLDAKLPDNNKPIYEFGTVPVCSGSWGCKVDTICTSSYLFASANIPRKVIEAVSDVMAMSPKTITEPK